jgi:hypothetical protein
LRKNEVQLLRIKQVGYLVAIEILELLWPSWRKSEYIGA